MKLTQANIIKFFEYRRLHNSPTLQEFMATYLLECAPEQTPYIDTVGNIHYDLRIDSTNRTLFTAHVDSVTQVGGMQRVMITDGVLHLHPKENISTCLGADDGSGILVLLALIKAHVPAYYVFTQGEERGGIGASYLADHNPDLLLQFDRAIAFDRKGTSSVISHQGWGRCCSDVFADALSDALSNDTLMYAPDDTGVYTDTAEFTTLIPECTNVSVGYYREHTKDESQDLAHLRALIAQAIKIDWDSLPTERDPLEVDDLYTADAFDDWSGKGVGWAFESTYGADQDWDTPYTVGCNKFSRVWSDAYNVIVLAMDGEAEDLAYYLNDALTDESGHLWIEYDYDDLEQALDHLEYTHDIEGISRIMAGLKRSQIYR